MAKMRCLTLILLLIFGCFGLLKAQAFDVSIDIKPGSDINSINLRSNGVITVAILTTDDPVFDATTVDPATVTFGPGAAQIAHRTGHVEDVDDDEDMDMVLHFRTQDIGLTSADESACITGTAIDGTDIKGCDAVSTMHELKIKNVPNGPKKSKGSKGPQGPKDPKGPKKPKDKDDPEDAEDENGEDDDDDSDNSKKPKKPKKSPALRISTTTAWGKIKAGD